MYDPPGNGKNLIAKFLKLAGSQLRYNNIEEMEKKW